MNSPALSAIGRLTQDSGIPTIKIARLPRGSFATLSFVLLLCVTPLLFNLLGVYFDSPKVDIAGTMGSEAGIAQLMADPRMLLRLGSGALHHTLLEWTAVMLALLTALLAFAHFRLDQEKIATPIIGIALCCSGVMDGFHILVSLRIVNFGAHDVDFIPFTWALARCFNAVILILGVVVCLRVASVSRLPGEKKNELLIMLAISAAFVALALLCMFWAASSRGLPQSFFPENGLSRPYDIVPIVLFI
ncbi:MAG: MASE3 domain-containing protein, partial [Pseudomonadales bacterium]